MNIHDTITDRIDLARAYAKDGAFYSAARCLAEAAAACVKHADGINDLMELKVEPTRFDPIIGEFGVDQGSMLALLSRAGLATDPGLKAYADAVETNDELEVDSDPLFSVSDDGCWVSAWVWVTNSEAGIEDDEEDDADEEATA